MINFTQEELELLTRDQLNRLCTYYDIQADKKWSKKKLITEVLEYLKPVTVFSDNTMPMSARIQRIYNSTYIKEE